MNLNLVSTVALGLLFLTGCNSTDLELGAPDLQTTLVLDKASYGIGEAMVATVKVSNRSDKKVSLPVPATGTLEFYKRPSDSPESLAVSFLDLPNDAPEFATVEPGEELTRTLLLPLATSSAGHFVFYAIYRSELEEGMVAFTPVASPSIELDIRPDVVWHRDTEGRITREEAQRLASTFFELPGAPVECQLIRDTTFRKDVWWCSVRLPSPDASGRTHRSCLVNPYLPAVQAETDESVPASAGAKPGA